MAKAAPAKKAAPQVPEIEEIEKGKVEMPEGGRQDLHRQAYKHLQAFMDTIGKVVTKQREGNMQRIMLSVQDSDAAITAAMERMAKRGE